MEGLRTFGITICTLLVISSVLLMLVPNLNKNKLAKLAISIFVIIGIAECIINSLNGIKEFEFDKKPNIEIENKAITEKVNDEAALKLYDVIKEELKKLGVYDDFGVRVESKMQKGGVKIEKVHITFIQLHKIEKKGLEEKLKNKLKLPIKIKISKAVK